MSSGNISCGIGLPQGFAKSPIDTGLIRAFLARAESRVYDSVWVYERIISDTPILEPITLLTYAAALTSRLRLGSSVLLTAMRNPVQLAKALSSLDQLSHGRLAVGVGLGDPPIRYEVFGVAREQRAGRFEEGIQVLKALWTQQKSTVSGKFWKFENVPMEPKPFQHPHPPIWFGARDLAGLRRAVRYGDGWMGAGSSSSAEFAQQVELLRRLLDDAKKDPATFPISKRVYIAVDRNRSRAETRLREWFARDYKDAGLASRVAIWGRTEECIERLRELVGAGATHLMLHPVFDELEHLELLADEVVPHLGGLRE